MSWGATGIQQTRSSVHWIHTDKICFLHAEHSLRKPPHVFGSHNVIKSAIVQQCCNVCLWVMCENQCGCGCRTGFVLLLRPKFLLRMRQCQMWAMECISTLLSACMTFFGPAWLHILLLLCASPVWPCRVTSEHADMLESQMLLLLSSENAWSAGDCWECSVGQWQQDSVLRHQGQARSPLQGQCGQVTKP